MVARTAFVSALISRRRLMTGVSPLMALALLSPDAAFAQTSTAPAGVRPDVAVQANTTTAQEAGTPQSQATDPAAQDNSPSPAGEASSADIIVTGLRSSLQRNLDIKRTATGVVDAISSEGIGKFPDSNVAASLQRLPGVSIQRSGARGEPTGITVRGFGGDFNTTLYDGRRISTATGGRQIDFSTVGSDFIGGISVLKTPDVSLASSSIGATVDIQFPKPFDHPGFRAAVSASGSLQDRAGHVVPTLGALVSDTFADDTIGILSSFIYTRRDTDTNRVFVSGWPGNGFAPCQLQGSTATVCNPVNSGNDPSQVRSLTGWFPQQYGAEQQRVQDERVDGRIALQWHPSEGVMVTLDNNFSRQTLNTDVYGFGVWFSQESLRNVKQDANGTAVSFTQAGSPTDFTSAHNRQILQTNQTGLNVKWDVTEKLTVEADGAYAKSWLNPGNVIGSQNGDIGYGGRLGTNLGFNITGDSNKAFPTISNFGPAGDGARWADPALIGSHVTVNQTQQNTDELKQFRGVATWKEDNITLKLGGQYVEDNFQLLNRSTFTNNFWQAYSGYGAPSGQGGGVSPLPSSLYQGSISLDKFIPGFAGGLPPSVLIYSPQAYQAYLSSLGNPYAQTIPGFNYPAPDDTSNGLRNFRGQFTEAVDPASILTVNEKTLSFFLSSAMEGRIGEMPLHVAFGVRTENTRLRSIGQGRQPTSITRSTTDPSLLTIGFSDTQPVARRNSYTYVLPSVDARLEVTDNLQLRFDASRTLTRPGLNLLNPVLNVGIGQRVGALSGSGGNPNLQPYLADNFDVAAEWYYQRNSYLAVDFFLKNVSNFIVGGVTRQTVNGVIDPTTGQPASFAISAQVNGPDATVRGVEIAWQQVFGDSGFGFQANATLVDTNKPYDATNISQTGFAVTGLANSANFVGFYDKNGFQIRTALNWRDEYLAGFGQNQNTGAYGAEPTFVNQSFQVDLTSSYDVTKDFSIFGEILNLNNNKQSTHGRFKNQLLDVFDYGRRFTLGARYRF